MTETETDFSAIDSGWIAVIVEPSGTYFRKPAALAKSSESDKAADILEAQEKAYATARVADTEKEEAEKAAALAGANAATDAPAAAPTSVSTVDAARRKGDGGGACHHCPPSADGLSTEIRVWDCVPPGFGGRVWGG